MVKKYDRFKGKEGKLMNLRLNNLSHITFHRGFSDLLFISAGRVGPDLQFRVCSTITEPMLRANLTWDLINEFFNVN